MKKLLVIFCSSLLILSILAVIFGCITYSRNEAFNTGIFNELVEAINVTKKIDSTDLLELEKLYELKTQISKTDITSFLYTIFSIAFISIGIFFINQISTTYEKTDQRAREIINDYAKIDIDAKNLRKDVDDLIKEKSKILASVKTANDDIRQIVIDTKSSQNAMSEMMGRIAIEYTILDSITQTCININTVQLMLISLNVDVRMGGKSYDYYVVPVTDCIKSIELFYNGVEKNRSLLIDEVKLSITSNISQCLHVIERISESLEDGERINEIFSNVISKLNELYDKFYNL